LPRYYFTNTVVNIWYSLPNSVVTANITNMLKNKLDKFWESRNIIYAKLQRTGHIKAETCARIGLYSVYVYVIYATY